MNVYDTANKLATEIKDSKEYAEFKKLKNEVLSNANKKAKIEEFEQLRYETQLQQMQGIVAEEKQNQLQSKYSDLIADEEMRKYFDAEMKFNVLIADVNKIIAEAVKDVL